MNQELLSVEFNILRSYIEKECGIALGKEKGYLIVNRLSKLAAENHCHSYIELLNKVKNDVTGKLKIKMIDAMTTNETMWFRDNHQFRVLKEVVFPELFDKLSRGQRRQIRIWSAACSTGQETYSLAITLSEFIEENPTFSAHSDDVSILGTDISQSAVMLAKLGRYNPILMSRGMTDGLQERYFIQEETYSQVVDRLKRNITFQQFNLQDSFRGLGRFDLVLMKNVLIYFSDSFRNEVYRKLSDVLYPDGFLFIGGTETMMGVDVDYFQAYVNGRATFYRFNVGNGE